MRDGAGTDTIGGGGGTVASGEAGPRRTIVEILVICALFLLTLLFLSAYGRRHVIYLMPPQVRIIPQPHNAYTVWKEAGLTGRVLLLFDRHLNANSVDRRENVRLDDLFLTPENYIYLASDQNVIRKIYHVIPDAAWDGVKAVLDSWKHVASSKGIYRLVIGEGVPVLIMRARDIPSLREKVVVSINGKYWDEAALLQVLQTMRSKGVSSDLATLAGPMTDGSIREIEAFYGIIRH